MANRTRPSLSHRWCARFTAFPTRSGWLQRSSAPQFRILIHSAAFRRLQGKTQLFPGRDSDFFRNRLTHSIEVAQIAKSIAIRLNKTESFFAGRKPKIETDLVETAALAHDLGHPPFGHNGEEALDECMIEAGGFEGNAQSLRIVAKLEKRSLHDASGMADPVNAAGDDIRAGLNLTYRTLASIIKYPRQIPRTSADRPSGPKGPIKGYYYTESDLVAAVMRQVGYNSEPAGFRTIECSIMDIADDIAYSTYDLEDSFKAGFTNPLKMLSASSDLAKRVAFEVKRRLDKSYSHLPESERQFSEQDVFIAIIKVFSSVLPILYQVEPDLFELGYCWRYASQHRGNKDFGAYGRSVGDHCQQRILQNKIYLIAS